MSANTILAGTDFSENSLDAVREAAAFGRDMNCGLNLVHVLSSQDAKEEENAESRLEDVADEISDNFEIDIEPAVYHGSPAKVLARLSRNDSVVLAAIGYSGKSGVVDRFGSVGSKVVRLIDKPVLVVASGRGWKGPVIGCVDFSGQTDKVNHWTHLVAEMKELSPVFVHVAVPYEFLIAATPHLGGFAYADTAIERLGGSEAAYRKRLTESVRHRLGLDEEGDVRVLLDRSPEHAISRFSREEEASLLVVGRHGHNTLGSRILGSTAEHLLDESHCSTLVIP